MDEREKVLTPAVNLLKKQKIAHKTHQYQHQANAQSYGLEAAQKMGVEIERVFKTLIVTVDNSQLVVAIIPVDQQLDMKLLAKIAGVKKAKMACAVDVERSTGYVLGGVSPLAQKKRLTCFLDSSATEHQSIFISAGKRGLEIEISADDLIFASQATLTALSKSE